MRRLLISGEGVTDCGDKEYGVEQWNEGPVQVYIRKILNEEVEIISIDKRDVFKARRSKKDKRTKLNGHGKKAFCLCLKAEMIEDVDSVLCYVDTDFERLTSNKEISITRKFNRIYDEIREGFQAYSEARGDNSIPVVPATMIESWLMGDENAYASLYGEVPTSPRIPSSIEFKWGQHDEPTSEFPKNILTRVLEQYDETCNRIVFCDIAKSSDINTLIITCALSFDRFYRDLLRISS